MPHIIPCNISLTA